MYTVYLGLSVPILRVNAISYLSADFDISMLTIMTLLANLADDTPRNIDDIFLIFPRKQDLTFHANCL